MADKHMKRCSTCHVLGNCKSKQENITTHVLEWFKSRTLATPSAGEEYGATGNLIQC